MENRKRQAGFRTFHRRALEVPAKRPRGTAPTHATSEARVDGRRQQGYAERGCKEIPHNGATTKRDVSASGSSEKGQEHQGSDGGSIFGG